MLTIIAAALLGAALYRVRGGGIPTGSTQLARLIWAVPTAALLVWAAQAPWYAHIPALLLTFAGIAWIGHAAHMDLGHILKGSPFAPKDGEHFEVVTRWILGMGFWDDFLGLSAIGFCRGLGMGGSVAVWAPEMLALVAIMAAAHPLAYAAGWKLSPHRWACPIGECLTGAACWAAVAALA